MILKNKITNNILGKRHAGFWDQNCLLRGKLSSSDDPDVSQKLTDYSRR